MPVAPEPPTAGFRPCVVIPTYNAGPSLRRAADSALTLPMVARVIVVDDGSSEPPLDFAVPQG